MESYKKFWKNYFNFKGCTNRYDYLYTILINIIILITTLIFIIMYESTFMMILLELYYISIIIPSWSMLIRRLHDTGKSGWYSLMTIIPYIGFIFTLIFILEKSLDINNPYKTTKNNNLRNDKKEEIKSFNINYSNIEY